MSQETDCMMRVEEDPDGSVSVIWQSAHSVVVLSCFKDGTLVRTAAASHIGGMPASTGLAPVRTHVRELHA